MFTWAGASMATTTTVLDNVSNGALTVTGYTDTGSGGSLVALGENVSNGCSDSNTASNCVPQLKWYSGGYGISSNATDTGAPAHATDNVGNKESLLINFGTNTKLEAVNIGYRSGDSDITVLAWAGSGAPIASTTTYGGSVNGLIARGWVLVGNYADVVANAAQAVNAAGVSSSYWLVMAYNSVFGTVNSGNKGTGVDLDGGDDYVKFYSVAYSTTSPSTGRVSEPATILMFGTAVFGLIGWRSRKQGKRPGNFAV
ncbi:MAG: PEP-CTERM sorting domain-containing protein [Rhodocyclales bacterium GT-UBC]|nr:MAG: PEP-CTERM sorting domain-containing protein [Rhodocyclales bacterium GT-UBC]